MLHIYDDEDDGDDEQAGDGDDEGDGDNDSGVNDIKRGKQEAGQGVA